MAKNKSTVYLGYDDEEITDKHVTLFNSTLNKIGGSPVSCAVVCMCFFLRVGWRGEMVRYSH